MVLLHIFLIWMKFVLLFCTWILLILYTQFKCSPTPGNATRLLTVQRKSIGLLNVKSQQFEAVQSSVSDPVALAFDVARGWYFWADSRGSIYKSDGKQSWTTYAGQSNKTVFTTLCDATAGCVFMTLPSYLHGVWNNWSRSVWTSVMFMFLMYFVGRIL